MKTGETAGRLGTLKKRAVVIAPAKKKVTPRRPRRRLSKLIFWLLVLTSAGILVARSGVGKIREVQCYADLSPESALDPVWCSAAKKIAVGQNLLTLNSRDLALALQARFPALHRAAITRVWPDTLTIAFQVRRPLIAVHPPAKEGSQSATPSDYFLVDESGLVFAREATVSNLPVLNYPGRELPPVGGSLPSGALSFVVSLLNSLRRWGVTTPALYWADESTLVVHLSSGAEVLFNTRGDAGKQAQILQLLLDKYRIEGKELKKVDLRFNDPAVTY